MTKKIGFIGAGKVGFSLGRHIREKSDNTFTTFGYYSRSRGSAEAAASFTGGKAFETPEELAEECDIILLTVPDGQITDVWNMLIPNIRAGHIIGHLSGALDSNIFSYSSETPLAGSCFFGSIHSILSLYDKDTSFSKLPGAYFTIEGDENFIDFAKALLSMLGNPFCTIDKSKKVLYHAASVMVSNLVNALTYKGMDVLKNCGLDDEFAENAWRSLFLGNAENISLRGPVLALTGPVERADAATVEKHLETLSGETREIYLLLSRILIEAAGSKNPERDFSELRKVLCIK
jgi:predicted short-subunit dehydrogenase-like oxidoreductase (DUF2520 family)